MASNEKKIISDSNKLLLLLLFVLAGWLFFKLSSVLMPFFVATLLAYLGDPLVDWLENKKLSRTQAVCIVFAAIFSSILIAVLILVPILGGQLASLFEKMPSYMDRLQSAIELIFQRIGLSKEMIDFQILSEGLKEYWTEAGKFAGDIVGYMTRSGMAVMLWLTNLLLIPVLTFYILRDWDDLVARFRSLLPRSYRQKITDMSIECDDMLAGFLRGQLLVMFALAIMYSAGLMLIGIDLAILIGFVSGLLSFVPYLGLIVGIILAGLAAYLQLQEWLPVLYVVIVFGVAQSVESMFLTPRFVGERIGLHPVAVIFAVMAGGALFGFIGILLALPVAAVSMVLLRHAHHRYVNSELYS